MSEPTPAWTEVTAALPDLVWYLSNDGTDMWCRAPYGFIFSTTDAALAFATAMGTTLTPPPIGVQARDLFAPTSLDGLRQRALTRFFVDPAIDAATGDVHGRIVRIEGPRDQASA